MLTSLRARVCQAYPPDLPRCAQVRQGAFIVGVVRPPQQAVFQQVKNPVSGPAIPYNLTCRNIIMRASNFFTTIVTGLGLSSTVSAQCMGALVPDDVTKPLLSHKRLIVGHEASFPGYDFVLKVCEGCITTKVSGTIPPNHHVHVWWGYPMAIRGICNVYNDRTPLPCNIWPSKSSTSFRPI
ncbi:hypothetical protein PoMZ_13475 [Pyricularia oryzae]|uniref:Uncharacterized protein n=1 Tax=Pyricularia oryzae TaxID=318829 RepID=A0A4P7NX74_PYROR|nr:hypothetical protein PoMZ_13475 [Pyricularia oryzae]